MSETTIEQLQSEQEVITKKAKSIVIYHGNCADGFGAAWCFYDLFMNTGATDSFVEFAEKIGIEFHKGIYGEDPPDVTGKIVYLVDFSYKRDVVERMLQTAFHIYFIDHHKTAIDDLLSDGLLQSERFPNFQAYTDLERSGAMLAWDFLHNIRQYDNEIHSVSKSHPAYMHPPRLLEYIQDRDLWKFKLPNSKEVNAYVFSNDYDFEVWSKMMRADEVELLQYTIAGAAIERKFQKDLKELLAVTKRPMLIGGYQVWTACLPYTFASEAGQEMCKNQWPLMFAATYYDTREHRIFSLRSIEGGIDVSEIVKLYGGGGHKHAAGFKVGRDHELARS